MSTETKIRPHDRAESFHSAINEQNVFVFFYQGPKTLGVQSDLKHHREVSRLWQRRQRSSGGVAGTVILGGLTNNVHRVEQSCSSLWCQQNYNNHWKPLTVSHTPTAEVYLTNGYMSIFSWVPKKMVHESGWQHCVTSTAHTGLYNGGETSQLPPCYPTVSRCLTIDFHWPTKTPLFWPWLKVSCRDFTGLFFWLLRDIDVW